MAEENELFEEFMKEMEQVQKNWAKAQEEIEQLTFVGESLKGQVKVTFNGKFVTQSVFISPALLKTLDAKSLERAIKEANNAAAKKAETYFQAQIEDAVKQMEAGDQKGQSQPAIRPRLQSANAGMIN